MFTCLGVCSYQSPYLDTFFVIGLVAFMCATVFAIYLQFTKSQAAGHVGVSIVVVCLMAALADKRHILGSIFASGDTQLHVVHDSNCCFVQKVTPRIPNEQSMHPFWRFLLPPPPL
jgi:hypothetical protein